MKVYPSQAAHTPPIGWMMVKGAVLCVLGNNKGLS